jgi:elongator complex protein 3
MDFSKINLDEHKKLARLIIKKASTQNFKNRAAFERFRNKIIKENKGVIFHNLYFIKAYNDLLQEKKITPNKSLLNLIQKRSIRTLSGVAPVTVMTKPFPCPGRCIYCPTDVRMPKSYLPGQPAAQRAFRQQFNPYTQVFVRLKSLYMTGHEISKVELRIIGGTWSAYKKTYQIWFIKQCLLAMNEFKKQMEWGRGDNMAKITQKQTIKSDYGEDEINTVFLKPIQKGAVKWEKIQKDNETGEIRCIGINVETRPDYVNKKEITRMRYLGVTKVEMGVQTTDEKVQKITKRGHDLKSVQKATKLLKDAGFKVGYHMMPNLPGSSVEIDKK